MCKFTIIMYPFCGHPYKEVAPKYARDAEKNYGNGVCRRYSIAFCERAKEGMRGPCVRWSSDETSYRLALMELQDTVVKVDYNDCNLEGGTTGCKAGTPKRKTDSFGRSAYNNPDGSPWTGPSRRVKRGHEENQYWYNKSWERNT